MERTLKGQLLKKGQGAIETAHRTASKPFLLYAFLDIHHVCCHGVL